MLTIRSPEGTGTQIQARVAAAFPSAGIHLEQYEKVGALVGKQLALKSTVCARAWGFWGF